MAKRCDWYRDDVCDCFCDGFDTSCENYSGDLPAGTDAEKETEIKK